MPLTKKYKFTWSSTYSTTALSNVIPTMGYEYNERTRSFQVMRGSSIHDFKVDVSDATSIYCQADVTNSTAPSTSITVDVHTSWGSTGDGTRDASGFQFTDNSNPYTSFNMAAASSTAPTLCKSALVTPGPDLLRFRADASASGGFGANEGLQLIVSVKHSQMR